MDGSGALVAGSSEELGALRSPRAHALVGVFEHSFDAKGRIVVPSVFRRWFADGGYLLQMPREGRYVAIFPTANFEAHVDRLRARIDAQLFRSDALAAALDRAHPIQPDVQGRVFIPEAFRTFAALGPTVELHGRDTHLALKRVPALPLSDDEAFEAYTDFVETELP